MKLIIFIILILMILILDIKIINLYLNNGIFNKNKLLILSDKIYRFIKDWRNAVSYLIAWFITNGIFYLFLFLGLTFKINWMKYIGGTVLSILYIPFVNEKFITIPIAIFIKKLLFNRKSKKVVPF